MVAFLFMVMIGMFFFLHTPDLLLELIVFSLNLKLVLDGALGIMCPKGLKILSLSNYTPLSHI